MKRVKNLITGGSGFIGSHLSKKLLSKGEEVICLDNYLTSSSDNIEQFLINPLFELINHDVKERIDLKVDQIWHLACPASPIDYQLNPIETSRTIFLGTYNMLDLARRSNAKILFASSSEVYGDPQEHPQIETYQGSVKTTGFRSCYEEGKRIAETLCNDFQRVYSVNIRIARIFNTYGPNMRISDGRVISNLIVQALNNKKLSIYGDGNQTRSFCYVDDLINGLILLMGSNYQKPINLGNPEELSINQLALIISNLINQKLDKEYKSLPYDDPKRRIPCIQLAKEQLNWEPKIELTKGLIKTINWFKEILE
tara:strand:- start:294 stop:1229 length:936 start_codon:yes stop_codon:yes gene_type:complete